EAGTLGQALAAVEQVFDVRAVVRVHPLVAGEGAVDQEVAACRAGTLAPFEVGLGHVAVVAPDRATLFVLGPKQDVQAVLDAGETGGDAGAEAVAAALAVAAAADVQGDAFHALLQ